MKIYSLINHGLLQLPKDWKTLGYGSYYECILKEGKKYLDLLSELDEDEISGTDHFLGSMNKQSLISLSQATFDAVKKCIEIYLEKGDPHKAYAEFENRFSAAKNKDKVDKSPVFAALSFISLGQQHYRLRESSKGLAKRKEIFHVPFEERHLVESRRFSIPGYPTLYLSNSVYLAYKELRDPQYDDLHVSKFICNEAYSGPCDLLDLRVEFQHDENKSEHYKYLARWPLLMACAIKVGHHSAAFKPEYILPQIILHWVKRNIKIGDKQPIGVTYSSSKLLRNEKYYGHFYNTAIPVHNANEKGFCEVLKQQFLITKPISFLNALSYQVEVQQTMQIKSIDLHGAKVEYIHTDFGKIETMLDKQPNNIALEIESED